MVIKVDVTRKQYKADNGKEYRYYEYIANLDGQNVRLYVNANQKAVSNYILDKIYK